MHNLGQIEKSLAGEQALIDLLNRAQPIIEQAHKLYEEAEPLIDEAMKEWQDCRPCGANFDGCYRASCQQRQFAGRGR